MAIRCHVCGVEAPDAKLYHVYYPSVSDPPQHFCPGCWGKREKTTERHEVYAVAVMLGVLCLAGLFAPADMGGGFARVGAMLLALYFASVVLHELGHAVAAWCLGMHVFKISIGMGSKVFSRRYGRTTVELHAIPVCGFVQPGDRSLTLARTRQFFVTFAGPAVNIGLAWLGFRVLGPQWRQGVAGVGDISFFHLLAGVNGLIAATSLIPSYFPRRQDLFGGGVQPNDGMLMLLYLFVARSRESQWWLAGSVMEEVDDLVRRGDLQAAKAAAVRGLERYPRVAALRFAHARALTRLGEHESARDALTELLQDNSLDGHIRTLAMAELASVHLTLGGEQNLAEADRLSREAFEAFPNSVEVLVTRGRVLVATGWVAKGCQVLRETLGALEDPGQRAACACYVARAELEQGDKEQAQRYLALARSLQPECPVIRAIEGEMGSRQGANAPREPDQ